MVQNIFFSEILKKIISAYISYKNILNFIVKLNKFIHGNLKEC